MIKVSIKNLEGVETNSASFSNREEADSWLSRHIEMGTWRFEDLIIPEILPDEMGRSKPEEVFPKTHSLELIEDYVDQESINQEARAYLASTDWMVMRSLEQGQLLPSSIADLRAAARARVK